jgi:hypothetical protein
MEHQSTSRDAFHGFAPVSDSVDARILAALTVAGADGLTDEEIERWLGEKHQTVSGNRRHLVERELVKDSGLKGTTSSGREAIKWVLAESEVVPNEEPKEHKTFEERPRAAQSWPEATIRDHHCHCGKFGPFGTPHGWRCREHWKARL